MSVLARCVKFARCVKHNESEIFRACRKRKKLSLRVQLGILRVCKYADIDEILVHTLKRISAQIENRIVLSAAVERDAAVDVFFAVYLGHDILVPRKFAHFTKHFGYVEFEPGKALLIVLQIDFDESAAVHLRKFLPVVKNHFANKAQASRITRSRKSVPAVEV